MINPRMGLRFKMSWRFARVLVTMSAHSTQKELSGKAKLHLPLNAWNYSVTILATLAIFNEFNSEAAPLDPYVDTGIALVQHLPVEGHDNVREKRLDYRIRHSRLFTPNCGSCRVKLDHDA